MPKRLLTGVVTRDKATQTRRVEVAGMVRHPIYGKIMHSRTVCYAHDADNASHNGDTVEIEESPPLSRLKRWVLKRIVSKATKSNVQVKDVAVTGETPTEN